MSAQHIATGASASGGSTGANAINLVVDVPASAQPGDRIFVTVSLKGGSALGPAGWTEIYESPYPGFNMQPPSDGQRLHSVFWRDYAAGWTANDRTFVVGADFSGQTAGVATALVFRKAASEEWAEPFWVAGRDAVSNTALSATMNSLPVRGSAKGFSMVTLPYPIAISSPSVSVNGTAIPTSTLLNKGITDGDDVCQVVHLLSPSSALFGSTVHTGTLGMARQAEVIVVMQDIIEPIDKPIVERVTEYEAKFDPRNGTTGRWLGGDVARDLPIPGTNKVLWIFADSFWRSGSTGVPTTRVDTTFTHSALALQNGPELTSSSLTFHFPPGGSDWFPIDANYYTWPQDAIFIGNDLYVFGQRVSAANPMGAEYGWSVHRIPNAKNLDITAWPQATLLYASPDTPVRPLWSPYDGGDGYIYAWGISRTDRTDKNGVVRKAGWRWCRWPVSYLTGTQQNLVEWWNGTTWDYGDNNGACIAENTLTSEGSAHKRASDGKWILTEGVGTTDAQDLAMRLGTTTPQTPTYLPPPPQYQVNDFAVAGGYECKILAKNGESGRFVRYLIDNTYGLQAVSNLSPKYQSDRYIYRNPRGVSDPIAPYNNYALKSHPLMPDVRGLIATFVDNGSSDQLNNDLSIYWPKFIVVKPPEISNLVYNRSTGAISWTVTGAPDRQFYRQDGEAWIEIDALMRSANLRPNAYIEIMARGIGGDTIVSTSAISKLRVGSALASELRVGATAASAAYAGTTRV